MITRSVTSMTQSGSAMNRSGSAAQFGSAMNRSGSLKGSSEENEFHICVRVCGVERRGKSLSGQFFVCEKDDRGESIMKSLAGMTRPKDEMELSLPSQTYLIRYLFI